MWLVELIGEESDLADFTRWFPDEPAKVINEEDSFYLVGDLFKDLTDASDVRSIAEDEVDLMSASIKLNCSGLSIRPTLGAVYWVDESGVRHAFAPGANLAVGTFIEIRVFDGPDQRPTTMQKYIQASKRNKSLHMAMLLWSDANRTWPRLYRILEEIEHAFGGRKSHEVGLASKAERSRFTQSANCHEVAGPDSRHGPKGQHPPANPMRISEAENFIAAVLGRASSRYENEAVA